jgi:sporulation protein YlmC with PRC-barrel domain
MGVPYRFMVVACVFGLLAGSNAWAQEKAGQPQARTQTQERQYQAKGGFHASGLCKASHLLGMKVRGQDGQDLGKIEDVVFDTKTGKIHYAAVSMGGFLGIGDKLVAVPWNSFQFQTRGEGAEAESYASVNINTQRLKMARGFEEESWPTSAEPIEGDVDVERQQPRPQPQSEQLDEQLD